MGDVNGTSVGGIPQNPEDRAIFDAGVKLGDARALLGDALDALEAAALRLADVEGAGRDLTNITMERSDVARISANLRRIAGDVARRRNMGPMPDTRSAAAAGSAVPA